jgi:hypothetical protein
MRYGMLDDMFFEEFEQNLLDSYFYNYEPIRKCFTYTDKVIAWLDQYFLPVRYNGEIVEGYYVDARGCIFSIKKSPQEPKLMKYDYARKGYPKIGIKVKYTNKTITVHRLVCESFHIKPIPEGVTKEEWDNTPKPVKKCFDDYWEVNHKDHNRRNYHPDNLEWVSRSQNVEKYQDYSYNKQLGMEATNV